jgi:hypothetical protein
MPVVYTRSERPRSALAEPDQQPVKSEPSRGRKYRRRCQNKTAVRFGRADPDLRARRKLQRFAGSQPPVVRLAFNSQPHRTPANRQGVRAVDEPAGWRIMGFLLQGPDFTHSVLPSPSWPLTERRPLDCIIYLNSNLRNVQSRTVVPHCSVNFPAHFKEITR